MFMVNPDAVAQPVTVEEDKDLTRDSSNVLLISAEDEPYEEREETPVDLCAGPSKAEESDTDSNSQTSEEAKIQLKTALVYCEQLLLENNKIATEPSAVIKEHMKIGEKLYSTIMETLAENIIVIEDDLILFEEANEEGLFEEVEDSGLQSDDEYHPDEKRSKIDTDDIPLDYKIKVVNLAKEHPKWSLKNLKKKGKFPSEENGSVENMGGTN
ncbi:HTH CENPB-type domain-containing protein [Trichonephila clavipes]|nr:HTH CENPB-type domain-containing protein [Trichonephila clavipes]